MKTLEEITEKIINKKNEGILLVKDELGRVTHYAWDIKGPRQVEQIESSFVSGNGCQVAAISERFNQEGVSTENFYSVLENFHCKPNPPYFTPRITAFSTTDESKIDLSILQADIACRRRWYNLYAGRPSGEYDIKAFPTHKENIEIELTEGQYCCITAPIILHDEIFLWGVYRFIIGPVKEQVYYKYY